MALASGLAAVAVIALSLPDTFDVPGRVQSAALELPSPNDDAGYDEDADGVADALDYCPGSTPGYPVTANGCEADADDDGVADGCDRCPGTRRGLRGIEEPVGPDGCSTRDGKKERSLPFSTVVG